MLPAFKPAFPTAAMPLAQAPTLCHPTANALVDLSYCSLWFIDSRGAIEAGGADYILIFLVSKEKKMIFWNHNLDNCSQFIIIRHFVRNKIFFKLLTSLQRKFIGKQNVFCLGSTREIIAVIYYFENESYLLVLITLSFVFCQWLP